MFRYCKRLCNILEIPMLSDLVFLEVVQAKSVITGAALLNAFSLVNSGLLVFSRLIYDPGVYL